MPSNSPTPDSAAVRTSTPHEDHIRFACAKCRHTLKVPAEAVGKQVRCRSCGQVQVVPGGASAQSSEQPAGPATGISETRASKRPWSTAVLIGATVLLLVIGVAVGVAVHLKNERDEQARSNERRADIELQLAEAANLASSANFDAAEQRLRTAQQLIDAGLPTGIADPLRAKLARVRDETAARNAAYVEVQNTRLADAVAQALAEAQAETQAFQFDVAAAVLERTEQKIHAAAAVNDNTRKLLSAQLTTAKRQLQAATGDHASKVAAGWVIVEGRFMRGSERDGIIASRTPPGSAPGTAANQRTEPIPATQDRPWPVPTGWGPFPWGTTSELLKRSYPDAHFLPGLDQILPGAYCDVCAMPDRITNAFDPNGSNLWLVLDSQGALRGFRIQYRCFTSEEILESLERKLCKPTRVAERVMHSDAYTFAANGSEPFVTWSFETTTVNVFLDGETPTLEAVDRRWYETERQALAERRRHDIRRVVTLAKGSDVQVPPVKGGWGRIRWGSTFAQLRNKFKEIGPHGESSSYSFGEPAKKLAGLYEVRLPISQDEIGSFTVSLSADPNFIVPVFTADYTALLSEDDGNGVLSDADKVREVRIELSSPAEPLGCYKLFYPYIRWGDDVALDCVAGVRDLYPPVDTVREKGWPAEPANRRWYNRYWLWNSTDVDVVIRHYLVDFVLKKELRDDVAPLPGAVTCSRIRILLVQPGFVAPG